MQSRLKILRNSKSEIIDQDFRERRVIIGDLNIDYSCFRKTKRERELLKIAKWQDKMEKKVVT